MRMGFLSSGSGIDLTKVPAIQQKRTVAFLNQFVVHTVQFLNRFSAVCEEKLADLSLRIQQIETTLNILDAKLSSIPGLEDVTVEVSPLNVTAVTNGSHSETTSEQTQQNSTQDSGAQESEAPSENVLTVAKDPRYARYLKMVQVFLSTEQEAVPCILASTPFTVTHLGMWKHCRKQLF
uniref:WASH complex subunit 3 n=1 Tax=Mus musculus TaxID=10090 RepID=Q9CYF6_MOUSE|nr:unnamed protein product [Mus musculus]